MGIKTTVRQVIAAKQNLSLPDPVTHDDFLKCEFFRLCVLLCISLNIDFREKTDAVFHLRRSVSASDATMRLWLRQLRQS